MTAFFNSVLGAFALTILGLFIFCATIILIRHERDAWRNRRQAAHWKRFCAACGGEESALKVVNAAEATADAAADYMMERGLTINDAMDRKSARKVIPFRIVTGKRETKFDSPPENAA